MISSAAAALLPRHCATAVVKKLLTIYRTPSGLQYAKVFIISNNSFRIGDSSFTRSSTAGTALLDTAVTDSATGIQTVSGLLT